MIYKVIGIMSGSSLDGLDIAYATITSTAQKWEFQIEHAETIAYTEEWQKDLSKFPNVSFSEYATLHTSYGKYIGEQINNFIEKHQLEHKVHFIASHGHTVYHNPKQHTTIQLGDGAHIAATTGLTTIADLRQMDVANGGQGAPIVPIADSLFFQDYKYCLNLGGIANISIKENNSLKAFDITAANQVLNHFAKKAGLAFDNNGDIAAQGSPHKQIINELHELPYFNIKGAKSLSNDFSEENIISKLSNLNTQDALNTACRHIAYEIKHAIMQNNTVFEPAQMLVTGGGAHNAYLVQVIQEELKELNIEVVVPTKELVDYKEALAMGLIGVLRWREEHNVLATVSGAKKDSIGGTIWLAE